MSIDRFDYDIGYDPENGRYEVEAIKCDDGAMICFEHYEKKDKELEQAKKRIAELEGAINKHMHGIENGLNEGDLPLSDDICLWRLLSNNHNNEGEV